MTATTGRRPADIGMDNRQMVWDRLRGCGAEWTAVAAICAATHVNRKTATDYLEALEAAKIVERRSVDGSPEVRLVRDAGHHAPRIRADGTPITQGAGVRNLWRSMCMLKQFSALDLSLHSTTPTVTVSLVTAKSYCAMLLATGYLRVVSKAEPARGALAVYRLLRNNGPKAPMIQRVKQVYDPNTGDVYQKAGRA